MPTMDHLQRIGHILIPFTCSWLFARRSQIMSVCVGWYRCTYHRITVQCMVKRKWYPLFFIGSLNDYQYFFIRLSHKTPTIVNISEPDAHANNNNAILRLIPSSRLFFSFSLCWTMSHFFHFVHSHPNFNSTLSLQRFVYCISNSRTNLHLNMT